MTEGIDTEKEERKGTRTSHEETACPLERKKR
jgi:hypothetical protein